MATKPNFRFATKMPTAMPIARVEWSLTNEKSVLPWIRTSRPSWSLKGRGRSTNPRMGMLTMMAMAAASGAQTMAAAAVTESSAVPRLRMLHQHHRPTRTRPNMIPYSPTNSMTRSNQVGAALARPLMS